MDGIVVKRYRGSDDKNYYLSLLSAQDFSLSENHKLPFFRDNAQLDASFCHEWLCLHDYRGKFVLYNIRTKQVKSLPPHKLDNPSEKPLSNGSCVGYDYKSGDYKVLRNFIECQPDGDLIDHTELYSLKTDSCKEIPSPDASISTSNGGVYLGGSYYWVACLSGKIKRGLPPSDFSLYVLSFDFASETFSAFPLPPPSRRLDTHHYLVDCGGSLGIITYPRPKQSESFVRPLVVSSKSSERLGISKSSKRSKRRSFELWVWKEMSWTKLYTAALHHVAKPLCLIDGRLSFFQGKTHRKQCDLVIYDWVTKEMKKFDICDYPGHMQVFSYVGSGVQLPLNAKPINGPYTEETKTETKAKAKAKAKSFLQACGSQNASLVRGEAKLIDTIDEGKTHHFIAPEERKFDQGLEGGSLEEIPAKRRRKKAYKEEDISDGGLQQ